MSLFIVPEHYGNVNMVHICTLLIVITYTYVYIDCNCNHSLSQYGIVYFEPCTVLRVPISV